jgi:hypothetical protein
MPVIQNPNILKGLEILVKYDPNSIDDADYANHAVFGPALEPSTISEMDLKELEKLGWDTYNLPNGKYRWRFKK